MTGSRFRNHRCSMAVALSIAAGGALAGGPWRLDACAPVPRPGQHVAISDESAVIVWDARTQTEHFIRRASFETRAADFGFLVPTPTPPALAESDDALFQQLEQEVAPEVVYQERFAGLDFTPLSLATLSRGSAVGSMPLAGGVRVLETTRVGGLDAAVLQPDGVSTGLIRAVGGGPRVPDRGQSAPDTNGRPVRAHGAGGVLAVTRSLAPHRRSRGPAAARAGG
jgi:hypothetical protein